MSTILIADDEEALLGVLSDAIATLGHTVIRATNGEEALTLVRSERPQLVLTDHMMPGLTGIELRQRMRGESELASIPVVIMSATRPRSLGPEDRGFLLKPVSLSALETLIDELLGGASSEARHSEPRAEGAATIREEMLRWVAHEIKTPLSAAQMAAQLTLKRIAAIGEPADRARVDVILRQLDRMNTLVNSVLDAARLADGKIVLKRERRELNEFLSGVAASWREVRPDQRIELIAHREPIWLSFDPERLRQVVDNLLSNAIKYGGPKPVSISVSLSPGLVSVRVADQGPGIDAAELPRLFDRFHRAQNAPGKGHGLGLYIAFQLARLHGGSLNARSESGAGATFCLSLPRAA